MAEAAVEDRPTQKFYCHMCNVQFTNLPANFTCPHCLDGFIEELLDDPPSTSSSAPGASATSEAQGTAGGSGSSNTEDWDTDDELFRMPPQRSRGEAVPQSSRQQSGSGGGGGGGFRRYQQDLPLEDIIQDVIRNWGQRFNYMPNLHLIMGNPDDYEWGNQQSLDAIVTQLLNQMENTGPPPLTRSEMDALPMVKCDHVQTDQKLQCSICWEEFKMDEHVRQLPCQHLYHASCIQPWLQLHATCPICRKRLFKRDSNGGDDDEEEGGDDREGNNSNNSSNEGDEDRDRDDDNNERSSGGNNADDRRSEFYDNDGDSRQEQVGHVNDPSTSASNPFLSNRTAAVDGDPTCAASSASTRDGGGGGNSAAAAATSVSPIATTNNRRTTTTTTTGGVNSNSNSSRRSSRGVTTRSSASQSAMEH